MIVMVNEKTVSIWQVALSVVVTQAGKIMDSTHALI